MSRIYLRSVVVRPWLISELRKGSGCLVTYYTPVAGRMHRESLMKSRTNSKDVSFFQSISCFFPTLKQMFSHQRQMSAVLPDLCGCCRGPRGRRGAAVNISGCLGVKTWWLHAYRNHVLAFRQLITWCNFLKGTAEEWPDFWVSRVVSCVKQKIPKSSWYF